MPQTCPPGPRRAGAGEGNRTLITSLEGWGSTIELHPRRPRPPRPAAGNGGGWIRTNVGASQRIYSPSPLATRAPLRDPGREPGRREGADYPVRGGAVNV